MDHPVGHHQGWSLSPYPLDLSIVGSNHMCNTVLGMFGFSFEYEIIYKLLNQVAKPLIL